MTAVHSCRKKFVLHLWFELLKFIDTDLLFNKFKYVRLLK